MGYTEPLLQPQEKRFNLFPIKYQDLYDLEKAASQQLWDADEIDLSSDRFDLITNEEQQYLKKLLGFFSVADGVVNQNIAQNFLNEVTIPEAGRYYKTQLRIEDVHAETYGLLIQKYIENIDEREKLFYAIENYPSIRMKTDWAIKWIESSNFVERLVAFALVEGLSFSSTFCGIFHFRATGLFPGLCQANTMIMRDETSHYQFALYLYNHYVANKLSEERLKEIVLSCYEVEIQFVKDSLGEDGLVGLPTGRMVQYVQYVTDTILEAFGCQTVFNVKQPFSHMANLVVERKTNFFERKSANYTRSTDSSFGLNEDC